LQTIEDALERSFGQKTIAAEFLGLSADQLRYKVLKMKDKYPQLLNNFKNISNCY